MIEVKGATFLTSQSSAPAGILIARPDIAEDTGVAIDWEVTNSAQNSLLALIAGEVDFAYVRSEEHTSELQSLMRISYAVFCLQQKKTKNTSTTIAIKHQ